MTTYEDKMAFLKQIHQEIEPRKQAIREAERWVTSRFQAKSRLWKKVSELSRAVRHSTAPTL